MHPHVHIERPAVRRSPYRVSVGGHRSLVHHYLGVAIHLRRGKVPDPDQEVPLGIGRQPACRVGFNDQPVDGIEVCVVRPPDGVAVPKCGRHPLRIVRVGHGTSLP